MTFAFAGGKGGVGKSIVCASVAIQLAQRHLRVRLPGDAAWRAQQRVQRRADTVEQSLEPAARGSASDCPVRIRFPWRKRGGGARPGYGEGTDHDCRFIPLDIRNTQEQEISSLRSTTHLGPIDQVLDPI